MSQYRFRTAGRFAGLLMSASLAGLFAPVAWAQENGQAAPTPADIPKAPDGEKAERPAPKKDDKPKRFPDFDEIVKDMQTVEGLLTLYRFDANDKNRDPERLLAKIPRGLLNEDMLFATSLTKAGSFTGWMWNDALFRFEITGNQLKLVIPDVRYVKQDDKPVADAIKRTYGDFYIAAVPILSMTPQGDVLIDLGALLKSNLADVPVRGGNIRPELSKWTKVKNFPENVLIEVDLAVGAREGGGGEVGVAYAFQKLPKLGAYKPRIADQRCGYFLTSRVDWALPNDVRETNLRYINRWHLEKRDPSLELSPPKKPITFIIEKTVPIQWRRYVRQGIEDWNKAYEKVGFVDAIVVQQQTDDNEFKDYDPEDARYNFIRWTVTGRALAVGPSRADPRTGQILDADIVCDDAWVRYFVNNFDLLSTPQGMASLKGPGFELYKKMYPELVPDLLKPELRQLDLSTPSADLPDLRQSLYRNPLDHMLDDVHNCNAHRGRACTFAEGMSEQLALAHYAMIATGSGKKLPERVIGEAVREVIAHEVGHTLGLRHNFKASSWLSLEEIKRRRDIENEPTVASVMDYNPLLFFADDEIEKVRHFATPTIGPYDQWVIEYGYRVPGKADKGEEEMLKEIASRSTQSGLDYATDEDTLGVFSPDPLVNRYDMGSSPADWARTRVGLVDKLSTDVLKWSIQDGEPLFYMTQAFNVLLSQKARNFTYVGRLVGGQSFNRDHKGAPDARPAFVIVDPDQQREALKILSESLFRDDFFRYPPELLNNLAPSRWSDDAFTMRVDYPIHDRIAQMQLITLVDIISPPVLQRVYDAELKSESPKKFTAAELITTVRDMVWWQMEASAATSAHTDAKPLISSIGRNLQKNYLNIMLGAAQMPPGSGMSADLNGMVRFALRELSDDMGNTLKTAKVDFASRAHLLECKSRIDRALEAQFTAR